MSMLQATILIRYIPDWTTWIILAAISIYGKGCRVYVYVCMCVCIGYCPSEYYVCCYIIGFYCFRSVCCLVQEGSTESFSGNSQGERRNQLSVSYLLMYVFMYVSVCMYVRMYVCMYVRMYVCMCVCMCVCMYVCMHLLYIHTHTHIFMCIQYIHFAWVFCLVAMCRLDIVWCNIKQVVYILCS